MKIRHLNIGQLFAVALVGAALAAPLTASAASVEEQIITAKAAALGLHITGYAISGLETVPNGQRIRYQNCDIYYSPAAGCHEIRGAIRDKYNVMGGPYGHMGLPRSDELTLSDGIGRYNEVSFPGKAIYWSPDTGPFPLEGDMRKVWVANGAERSRFGYPTAQALYQNGYQWGDFQSDVIVLKDAQVRTPVTAGLTRAQVSKVIYNFIKGVWGNVNPKIDRFSISGVSPTGYDFSQSRNRLVKVHLEGRREVYLIPDPTYVMDLQVLFFAQKEVDGSTSLRMKLVDFHWTVTSHGDSGWYTTNLEYFLSVLVGRFSPSVKLIDVNIPAAVSVFSFKVLQDGEIKLYLQPDDSALVRLAVQLALDRLAK